MISFDGALDHEGLWVEHVCFNLTESLMATCSSAEVYIWATNGCHDHSNVGMSSDVPVRGRGRDQKTVDQKEEEEADRKSITSDKDARTAKCGTFGKVDCVPGLGMVHHPQPSFFLLGRLAHNDVVWKAKFNGDGASTLLYTACSDSFIYVWNILDFTLHVKSREYTCHRKICVAPEKGIFSFTVFKDIIFAGNSDGLLKVFQVSSGKMISCLEVHNANIEDVCVSESVSRVASCSKDRTACLLRWDDSSGTVKKLHRLKGHKHWVFQVNFSLNGFFLATASADKNAAVWSVKSGRLLQVLRGHSNIVWSAVFIQQEETSGNWEAGVSTESVKRAKSLEVLQDTVPPNSVTPSTYQPPTVNSQYVSGSLISCSGPAFSLISVSSEKITDIKTSPSPGSEHLEAIPDKKKEEISEDGASERCFLVTCSSDFSLRLWRISDEKSDPLLEVHRNLGGSGTGIEQLFSCSYAEKLGTLVVGSNHGKAYFAHVRQTQNDIKVHD